LRAAPTVACWRRGARVADLGGEAGRAQRVDPAEAAQPADHARVAPGRHSLLERRQQARAADGQHLDAGNVVGDRTTIERPTGGCSRTSAAIASGLP
jgi:hypothetical protein